MPRGLFSYKAAKEVKVLEGVEGAGKSAYSDDAWAQSELLYEPPLLEVTQPKGSFCNIHTRFAAALDPDGVYDIVTDPNNYRVFKNIKEVVYRKVLEDDGNRQYVEVEQLGRWKFMFVTGSFATRIFLEQKRQEKTLSFDLAKQGGMMRKFTGSWKIEPMRASEAAATQALSSTASASANPVEKASQTEPETKTQPETKTETEEDPVVGSWVTFEQVVEPSIKPPWPISSYIRGITEKIIRDMLADLQRECQRLSELHKTSSSSSHDALATPAAPVTPATPATPAVDPDQHDLKGSQSV